MKRVAVIAVLAASFFAAVAWLAVSRSSAELAIAGVLGLVFGSFANVVRHRWPAAESAQFRAAARAELKLPEEISDATSPLKAISVGGSCCPSCGSKIGALQLVPVVSWLFLKGKCKACATSIPLRYPLVELLMGALAAGAVWQFGFGLTGLLVAAVLWVSVILSLIDIDELYLPEAWSSALVCLVAGLMAFALPSAKLADALVAGLAAYVVVGKIIPFVLQLVLKKQALGGGDPILFALLGAVAGTQQLPTAILACAFIGILTYLGVAIGAKDKENMQIPMGPAILMTMQAYLLAGKSVLS